MSMFSIFHSLQPQADDFECALSSHWLWRSQDLPELWTQDESQVQMEVTVESRPKFPQQGLLRNKAGRVGIANSHRCRKAQDNGWGAGEGPFSTFICVSSQAYLLKRGHCCLNPVTELVNSRRPPLKVADGPWWKDYPPIALPRHQEYKTVATLSGAWRTKYRKLQWSCNSERGVWTPVGISKVLAMIWVLTSLSGQIRLKLMTPLCFLLHWNSQTVCFFCVWMLCEGQQGLGPPFLLSPLSCCCLHVAVNVKKKKRKKEKRRQKWNDTGSKLHHSGMVTTVTFSARRKISLKDLRGKNAKLGGKEKKNPT